MSDPESTSKAGSTPSELRSAHPGKHHLYVFGQMSADGVACIGCSWQSWQPGHMRETIAAIRQHDTDMALEHDHDVWLPIERGPMAGTCPCGKPDLYEDSPLRRKLQATLRGVMHWGLTPEQLTEIVIGAIVPDAGVLVSFETKPYTESDWELGYEVSSTDLASPEVLAHRLSERELAELYFQIEAVGSLGESDAYHQLDKAIEQLGEPAATKRRTTSEESQLRLKPHE